MAFHDTLEGNHCDLHFELQADAAKVEYRANVGDAWGTAISAIVTERRDGTEFSARNKDKVSRITITILTDPTNATYGGLAAVNQGAQFRLDGTTIWSVATERESVRTFSNYHEVDLVRSSPRADGVGRQGIRRR